MRRLLFIVSLMLGILGYEIPSSGASLGGGESLALKSKDIHGVLQEVECERRKQDSRELKKLAYMLNRAAELQDYFDAEENPKLLRRAGDSLRSFYYSQRMVRSALKNDLKLHECQPSVETLRNVIESLILLDMNEEALGYSRQIGSTDSLVSLLLYGALAYARNHQLPESRRLLERVDRSKCTAPELYIYLQVAAVSRDSQLASELLKRILENAPPEEMAGLRRQFRSGEFANVSSAPEYQEALKTETKARRGQGQCPNSGTIRCGGGEE